MSSVLCIILNWRTAEMTARAVEAAITAMQGIEGSITVVDNDSQDGSYEALSAAGWPGVRVLQAGRNGGFGAGNNHGIRAGLPDGSAPDYVYILNSDAFPAPDAIRVLVDHLDTHPQVGFAGSHIHGPDGAPHTTAFRFPSIASEFEGAAKTGPISKLLKSAIVAPALPSTTTLVDWVAGASVLMRREMLDQIGLFDETFFLYFEETDLFLRGARAGWRAVYVVESRVMHIGSVSTGMKEWARVPRYWFASRRHYFEKNHGRLYALAATAAHVAGLGIYGLRVVLQRKPRQTPPHFLRDLLRHSL
ncbi:glycosyltransferase family 2 protein [Pararhodobacter zhoushanensis]|uniref:Glycosyltransferase family 2 protein n=1 Tax=Pararhodobacter zhoushanensis TaxID=2479545 RepID=A0ABT3GUQ3_9RHOB|nr:glycosyltransferase family 2 protein [Pararhodobacter zhoushanensis]MCW1931253.1 glycosyltransferase family 2 protein [Pararhodobacter zhoushanensis]